MGGGEPGLEHDGNNLFVIQLSEQDELECAKKQLCCDVEAKKMSICSGAIDGTAGNKEFIPVM